MSNKELAYEIVNEIESRGMMLMPKDFAKYAVQFDARREKLMREKSVSLYKAAKFGLVNGISSLKTLKNMIADSRIKSNEFYKNSKGTYMILTAAIKRLNNK